MILSESIGTPRMTASGPEMALLRLANCPGRRMAAGVGDGRRPTGGAPGARSPDLAADANGEPVYDDPSEAGATPQDTNDPDASVAEVTPG
jgi:hypothetical protein